MSDTDTPVGESLPETPTEETVEKTFTQTDVDRIVRDRLARAKTEPPADYQDLKAKAAKFDELEAANRTELERAQHDNETLRKEIESERAARAEASLRASVVTEAAKRNVIDPDAAIKLIDRNTLEFDDAGTPLNVPDVMSELITARPYLVAQPETRGSADQGARRGGPGQVTEAELKTMSWQEVEQARKEGRLKSLLGAS